MCDPVTLAVGSMAASTIMTAMQKPPAMPAQVKPPEQQQAKAPQAAGGGGPVGVSSTMLTGPQGVDPSTLLLGKPKLTGTNTLGG